MVSFIDDHRREYGVEPICAVLPIVPSTWHHSERGVQYLSIRYTERLAEAGIEPSVGSRGDSFECIASAGELERARAAPM